LLQGRKPAPRVPSAAYARENMGGTMHGQQEYPWLSAAGARVPM